MPVPGAAASRATPSRIISSNRSGGIGGWRRVAHVLITPNQSGAGPSSASASAPSRRKQLDDLMREDSRCSKMHQPRRAYGAAFSSAPAGSAPSRMRVKVCAAEYHRLMADSPCLKRASLTSALVKYVSEAELVSCGLMALRQLLALWIGDEVEGQAVARGLDVARAKQCVEAGALSAVASALEAQPASLTDEQSIELYDHALATLLAYLGQTPAEDRVLAFVESGAVGPVVAALASLSPQAKPTKQLSVDDPASTVLTGLTFHLMVLSSSSAGATAVAAAGGAAAVSQAHARYGRAPHLREVLTALTKHFEQMEAAPSAPPKGRPKGGEHGGGAPSGAPSPAAASGKASGKASGEAELAGGAIGADFYY